ncbi:hypothetical protein BEWA_046680 [Theileria equi strain WA]|uniref:Signal peptide-containing protein n=1 Tax=Theileria equi strain WA TaxID=1537102 RepID=L1LAC2_THEEQ|nr:hypothetical protein BEWA_046680 [Theileria equi strain WA]EKX72204.1 hypothetical protein BEWA_046680 [Theileria equi strain WA]|eukprot:XP_004831656.1 hypothetical protein BEWA_046680 [Theileria equi strain WA]
MSAGELTLNVKCQGGDKGQCNCGAGPLPGITAKKETDLQSVRGFYSYVHERKTPFTLKKTLGNNEELDGNDVDSVTKVSVFYWNENETRPLLLEIIKNNNDLEKEYYYKYGNNENEAADHPSLEDFPMVTTDPNTFDLAVQNSSSYRSFDVNIQGISTKVYVSTCGNTIKKVVNGSKDVWTATSKQARIYCIVFLKDNNLSMALVKIRDNDNKVSYILTELDKDKWVISPGHSISGRVNGLKKPTDTITRFSIDISLANSNDKCIVENYESNGLKARFYPAQAAIAIGKITDGSTTIGELNKSYTCYLCEYYSKGGVTIIRVHAQNNYNLTMFSYKKDADKWTSISGRDFSDELVKMSN